MMIATQQQAAGAEGRLTRHRLHLPGQPPPGIPDFPRLQLESFVSAKLERDGAVIRE